MYGTVEDPPSLPLVSEEEGASLVKSGGTASGHTPLEERLQWVMLAVTVFLIVAILVLVVKGQPLPILGEHHHVNHPHPLQLPDLEKALPLAPEVDTQSMFIGAQVRTRQAFGYGLYIFEAMANIHQEGVVTEVAASAPRPPASNTKASGLWRWSECSWAFVPGSKASQRERVDCTDPFPNAKCATVRTDGTNVDGAAAAHPVVGRYTDDVIARAVSADLARKGKDPSLLPRRWQELVGSTGKGGLFRYGDDWPLPEGLCYREVEDMRAPLPTPATDEDGNPLPVARPLRCDQVVPEGFELTNAVAINVVRTAPGFAQLRANKEATFVPHRKENSNDFSGFPMGSQQIIYNQGFNPYTRFHTYTVKVAPDGIAFYIDAPDKGLGIDKQPPVQSFSLDEFPSLNFFGPQQPGAGIPFNVTTGQAANLDTPFELGHAQFVLSMFINEEWGGRPGEFKSTETYVRRLQYTPLPKPFSLQETVSDLLHQKRPEPSFDVDFSKWDPEGWWHRFRGLFMADQTTSHSVLNVDVEEAPDGITALKLSVRRNGHLTGRTLYRLNAKQPTKIIDANTNKIWAMTAFSGQYDVFPFPSGATELNVSIHVTLAKQICRCGYTLNPSGWYLTPGQGDRNNGAGCSFLPRSNDVQGHYWRVLPDASIEVDLTLLDLGLPAAIHEPNPVPVYDEDPALASLPLPWPPSSPGPSPTPEPSAIPRPSPSAKATPPPSPPLPSPDPRDPPRPGHSPKPADSPKPSRHSKAPKAPKPPAPLPADLPPPPPPPQEEAPPPPAELGPPEMPVVPAPPAPEVEPPAPPPAPAA